MLIVFGIVLFLSISTIRAAPTETATEKFLGISTIRTLAAFYKTTTEEFLSTSTIRAAPKETTTEEFSSISTIRAAPNETTTEEFLSTSTTQAAPTETTTEEYIDDYTGSPATPRELKWCREELTCLWDIYNPLNKEHLYYVQMCVCPPDKICERQYEHLSIGGWIYQCKDKPSTTTKKLENVEGLNA